MNKLDFDGAFGAVNAFAVSDDGKSAFLFDPRVNAVIRIDVSNGNRDTLRWYDRDFRHPRWLCYCMFTMHRDRATYLPTLFYNKKRKAFILIIFLVDTHKLVLLKTQENFIDVEPIRFERLAYSAHKDESKLHIVFYDRFEKHTRADTVEDPTLGLPVVYCCFNCHTLRLATLKKTLPAGQWELPFVAHQSLHFVSIEFSTTQLASISTDHDIENATWNIRPVAADLNDVLPPKKATYINAWRSGMGWYIVCEKQIENFETIRCITLWQLDVLDCKWRKLPARMTVPLAAKNFALRVDTLNNAFLHCDWDRKATVFRMDLNELMLKREDEAVAASEGIFQEELPMSDDKDVSNSAELSNSEIICPICLDTYDDPRTLACGHSTCSNCIEQMKVAAQSNTIRCFACRKATTIPSSGLPVNFGLRDAIEALEKVRQLSFSNLRCAHCRKLCEEADLWVCVECASENTALISAEILSSVTEGHKNHLFCAQCILKHHTIHKVDELPKFRERYKSAKEAHSNCKTEIDQLFANFKSTLTEKLQSGLFEPLENDAELEIKRVFNAIAYNQENEIGSRDEVIKNLEERLSRIVVNIDTQFEVSFQK